MQLFRIIPLEKDLWAINEIDKTVMYVINGTERALLLDTGLGLTDLKEEVLKLCGEKSLIVVNTHAHVDHNSGNYQFEEVCVGRYDEPFSHQIVDQELREMSELMFFEIPEKEGFSFEMWNPGPARKICTVRDGDIFDLGDKKLKVLEVPSHTLGCIALFEEKKGWLFTGDIMLTWEVWGHLNPGKSPLAPSASLRVYYESLLKLKKIRKKEQIEESVLKTYQASNPSLYYVYEVIGDYYEAMQQSKQAIAYWQQALKKSIPKLQEKERIQQKIQKQS